MLSRLVACIGSGSPLRNLRTRISRTKDKEHADVSGETRASWVAIIGRIPGIVGI